MRVQTNPHTTHGDQHILTLRPSNTRDTDILMSMLHVHSTHGGGKQLTAVSTAATLIDLNKYRVTLFNSRDTAVL